MELTGILFLVLVILGFALFVFGLVKAFSGWGAWYTVMLVFTFLACLAFLFASAGVASRRIEWVRVHDKLKDKLDKLQEEARLLKSGNIYSSTLDFSSLQPLASEVSRITVERGRVWRGASLADFKPDAIRLTMASQPAPAPAGGAATPPVAEVNGDLPVEHVVYGFSESQSSDGKMLPKAYVGEYVVAESQGGTALLRPVVPLTPFQVAAINEATTWTVFELMPLDSHIAFAEPNSKRPNEAEFGRMDEKIIADLLQIPVDLLTREPSQLSESESRAAKQLRAYVLDGSRAPENELAENVWYRIEFLADHKFDVDVTKGDSIATDGGYFDSIGRANDARLKRVKEDGTVTIKKGQQVVFAKEPAEKLIEQGVAKKIEPIFVRQLNDYSIAFNETRVRTARAIQDAEDVSRDIAQVQGTNSVAQEQIVFRQNERQLLDKDKAQYDKESQVISAEVKRMTDLVKETKAELSRIYRANQEHYRRLIDTQQALRATAN